MELNLNTLNQEQKEAAKHDTGPLLIVAGAGTGKTTVIAQRIGWLIEQEKCRADGILALTFTEKAAAEMEERIDRLLPYGYVDLWVLTFHAFAEKMLQRHALEIGIPNDFKLLNQTEQWLLVRRNLDKFGLDFYKPRGNPTKFIHALVKHFSRAKDEDVSPDDYLKYAESLRLNADSADFVKTLVDADALKTLSKKEQKTLIAQEIQKVEEVANAYHVYQQLLLENNSLDFGDLINYCLKLFRERPAILAKYRAQFKYILVDEFQDTNYAQYELVKILAEPANNITVVGDDDQAIYKFRGASISNILEFKKDFPDAKEIFLTKNYRSTQDILDLSYKFIQQNNPYRLEVRLAEGKKGKKTLLTKKLESHHGAKGTVMHLAFAAADDEIRGVLKRIAAIKEADQQLLWSDFAILARTNDTANSFAMALSRTHIPYRFVASRGLYAKAVVLDILAYLRLLDNYHESSAVHRILSSPIVGLEDKAVVNLGYWAKRKGYSLYATLQQPDVVRDFNTDAQEKFRKFGAWVTSHTALARQKPVSAVIMAFLTDTGYLENITKTETLETVEQIGYLNQFYRRVQEFERAGRGQLVKDFLEFIELELEAGETGSLDQNLDEGPDAVRVMTVHAAKGLEFSHVFVVNMVDRRFPTDDRSDAIALPDALVKEILPEGDVHLQEERRLFYVAMTRARSGLYFTTAEDYGGARKKKPSRFLNELEPLGLGLDKTPQMRSVVLEKSASTVMPARLKQSDVAILLPKKFSFTQLKAFKRCPYHYWLEYVLRIPQSGKPIFSFGTSMHLTLQRFFEQVTVRAGSTQADLFGTPKLNKPDKSLVTLKELIELYEQSWIDDWYEDRKQHDEFKESGKRMLKEFYKNYEKELPVPKALERMFNFTITEGNERYTVVGKIDRVDPLDGGIEIVDYKTGQPKKELSREDKEQLLMYQLAAEQAFGEQVKKLTYYFLETGDRPTFIGSEKELAQMRRDIVTWINEIRSYPFPATPEQCTCNNYGIH